jgi:hypothetical protein
VFGCRVVSSNVDDVETAVNFSLPPLLLLGRRDDEPEPDPDECG